MQAPAMLNLLDLFGTFAFALSGAFRAIKYELDLLGVLVLATATGVGGGIMADLMAGNGTPFAFRDERYLLICLAGGLVVFVASKRIAPWWDGVMAADAVGLGVFAALGAAKATGAGLGHVGILMLAAITATGGGVVRDVLVREIPAVLRTGFYATAAIAGAIVFDGVRLGGYSLNTQLFSCILVTFILRLLAMRYKVGLPRIRRLPNHSNVLKQ
ncbi:MAG: trimeric intracellular cation channel family protein [Kiritimatiellia bacterium]